MKQRTPEWLAARREGIGGSDAAAVLGLSPWRTSYDVFVEKAGIEEPIAIESDAMRWGTLMEPMVRAEYERVTGYSVAVIDDIQRHPRHSWLLGSLDGRVRDDGRVLEIKTARSGQGWGEPGTDQIPLHYAAQVHHYMLVTGATLADVAVLIGGSDFRIYHVPADPELHEQMEEAEATFWQRVVRREPPDAVTVADAISRWGRMAVAGAVKADADVLAAIGTLRAVKAEIAALEATQDEAKATVLRVLADRGDVLTDDAGRILATWKATKPGSRLDAKALTSAHPDIAARFSVQQAPLRRFLLKE